MATSWSVSRRVRLPATESEVNITVRSGRTTAAAARLRTSHWWSSDPGSGTTGAAPLCRIRSRSSRVIARASSAKPSPTTSSNRLASGSTAVGAFGRRRPRAKSSTTGATPTASWPHSGTRGALVTLMCRPASNVGSSVDGCGGRLVWMESKVELFADPKGLPGGGPVGPRAGGPAWGSSKNGAAGSGREENGDGFVSDLASHLREVSDAEPAA